MNHLTVSLDAYRNGGRNKTANQDWANRLGIRGIPADDGSFPAVGFQGGTAAPVNFGRAYDEDWRDLSLSVNESLTRSIGRHTIKVGGEAGRYSVDRFFTGGAGGSFVFSNFTTSQPNGGAAFATQGSAFASFLLGEVFQASALIPVDTRFVYQRYALFAQDEWRVTPNLTFSVRAAVGLPAADDGSRQSDEQFRARFAQSARRRAARRAGVCRDRPVSAGISRTTGTAVSAREWEWATR